jgi:hypothetical protein
MAIKELNFDDEDDMITVDDKDVKNDQENKPKYSLREIKDDGGIDKVWTLPELKIIKPPIVAYIPEYILLMMRSIEAKLKSSNVSEFGAFLSGELEDDKLIISSDFLVLKQRVTTATIDFDEDPPDSYNGVIHRHPNGCTKFSHQDDTSINENYYFSLLYVNNVINGGIINLDIGNDVRIQLPLSIKIVYPNISVDESIMSAIINKHHTPSNQNYKYTDSLLEWDKIDLRGPNNSKPSSDHSFELGSGYLLEGETIIDPDGDIIEECDLPDECFDSYFSKVNGDEIC